MSWFDRDLNPGPLAPLTNALPLHQRAKGKSSKKICHYKIPLLSEAKCIGISYRQVFFSKFSFAPWSRGRVLGKGARGPGFKSRWNQDMKKFYRGGTHNIFFITLRVPTLRFGGSFILYLTFYSFPFWRGVERNASSVSNAAKDYGLRRP